MKRYTPKDFKTAFAKDQAEARLGYIDWDLLEQYASTDLGRKVTDAVQNIIFWYRGITDDWHRNHPPIELSDGDKVSATTGNHYLLGHNHHIGLKALEIFEQTFMMTQDVDELIHHFTYETDPAEGQYNFALMMKMFPYEATHIYFHFKYAEAFKNPDAQKTVTQYLDSVLAQNGYMRGPMPQPANAFDVVEIIKGGWPIMDDVISQVLKLAPFSPQAKGGRPPGNEGP